MQPEIPAGCRVQAKRRSACNDAAFAYTLEGCELTR